MFGSYLGFAVFATKLPGYEPPPVLEYCYIPLRMATDGLMNFVGSIGIATDGMLDLPCTEAPVDAWREIIRIDSYLHRRHECHLEF